MKHTIYFHAYKYVILTHIYIRMHTCINPYTHTNTYTHKSIHTHRYIYVHECIHTYIHASNMYTHIHTYIHIYIHTFIHSYIHTYMHTYIRIHKRATCEMAGLSFVGWNRCWNKPNMPYTATCTASFPPTPPLPLFTSTPTSFPPPLFSVLPRVPFVVCQSSLPRSAYVTLACVCMMFAVVLSFLPATRPLHPCPRPQPGRPEGRKDQMSGFLLPFHGEGHDPSLPCPSNPYLLLSAPSCFLLLLLCSIFLLRIETEQLN